MERHAPAPSWRETRLGTATRRLIHAALAFALVTLAATDPARPCGAFFPTRAEQNLAIDAQRALMVVGENRIDLHLQLAADSGDADFAWVVPVPKAPELALGDSAIFDALDVATRPTVTFTGGSDSGGGFCGSAADAKGGLGRNDQGINHFGGGTLGNYTYDIVGGGDGAALESWLTDKGYRVPDALDEAIAPYLAASVFVAVRLTARAEVADLQPLVISYARPFGASLGYAFAIGKLSTPDTAPFVLWVLADKRYRVANYGSVEVKRIASTMRDRGLDYAGAVSELTSEAGGRLTIVEFARDISADNALVAALGDAVGESTHYLTRLYGDIPRDAMEDLVLTFAVDAPDVDNEVEVSRGPGSTAIAMAFGLVGLGLIRSTRRRSGDQMNRPPHD